MGYLFVNTNRLNVLNEPIIGAKPIAVINKGQIVKKLGFIDNYYWVKIKTKGGKIGFCPFKYFLVFPDKKDIKTSDPRFLKIAFGEKNIVELKDPNENHRILQYLGTCEKFTNEDAKLSDETHWCSAFMNWCIEKAEYEGTNSALALHWRTWGRKINPRRGAIAVFERYSKNGEVGGHVGFYLSKSGENKISILGGNQSNSVKISDYPIENKYYKLVGFRAPNVPS